MRARSGSSDRGRGTSVESRSDDVCSTQVWRGLQTMPLDGRGVTVGGMTAHKGSSAGRPRINIYQDLRARNQRRADVARLRENRARIERALQAARERRFGKRG